MDLSAAIRHGAKASEFFLRKNAPTILTGAGVAGFIATVALTVKATHEAEEAFPIISKGMKVAKTRVISDEFTEHDKIKGITEQYIESFKILGKIYAPVFACGTASILFVASAHGMMRKRQASLVAAYTALDAGFRAYRQRVQDQIGVDEERQLFRAPRSILDLDDEAQACEIRDALRHELLPSPYAKFFDETSQNWSKTPDYNLMFLHSQQKYANDRLRADGFLFLNDVYHSLGLERTQAGQMVGWKLDGNGDGFVDFGIYDIADECNRAFVNGLEHTVLLDFNVDGVITI